MAGCEQAAFGSDTERADVFQMTDFTLKHV